MGFRLTTLQIAGRDRDALCRLLGLRATGVVGDTCFETVSGRRQPDGSYLIVAMDDRGRHGEPAMLRSLSAGTDLLVCQIHEGCMWSQVGGWHNGDQVWSVEHVSDEGSDHLDVIGNPPPPFAAIRREREAQQAAVAGRWFSADHIFDVAPALYAALTGYRYDRFDPAADFEVLTPLDA